MLSGRVNLTLIVALDEAIPPPDQIDRRWLTGVLKRNGTLISGGIRNLQVDALPSTNSHIVRIRVEYDSEACGDPPQSLILKTVEAGAGFIHTSEVDYYTRDYLGLVDAPIPKCYAAHASANGSYSILAKDLSLTHEKDTSPTLKYGLAVANSLARLHAFGWGEERIRRLGGCIPDDSRIEQYVGHVRQGRDALLEATRMDIPDSWRQAILDVFQYHPGKMLQRTQDSAGFAVVHGDVNPGNVLYPITNREWTRMDPNTEAKVYFLDRQPFTWSLTTWLGVSDLSYLMVQYWDTSLRRELEMPVLREYHRQLVAYGVGGYDWDQLIADYKLCAVQAVYTVAEWCINDRERMRWLWRLELERAMHTFFDLGCSKFWQPRPMTNNK